MDWRSPKAKAKIKTKASAKQKNDSTSSHLRNVPQNRCGWQLARLAHV